MSAELISVLVAVLAIGATLAGLILTSNRGLRQDNTARHGATGVSAGLSGSMGWSPGLMQWRSSLVNSANAWRTLEDCRKGCERPSADGLRPAKDGKSHAGQAASAPQQLHRTPLRPRRK